MAFTADNILQGEKNRVGIVIFSYKLWKQHKKKVLELRYGLEIKQLGRSRGEMPGTK